MVNDPQFHYEEKAEDTSFFSKASGFYWNVEKGWSGVRSLGYLIIRVLVFKHTPRSFVTSRSVRRDSYRICLLFRISTFQTNTFLLPLLDLLDKIWCYSRLFQ